MSEKENNTENQKLKTSKLAIVSLLLVIVSFIILPFRLKVYRPEYIDISGWHIVRSLGLIILPLSFYALLHIRKHKDKLKGKSFALMGAIFAACVLLWFLQEKFDRREPGYDFPCGSHINGLGKAVKLYEGDFGQYPDPDKWCDLLVKFCDVDLKLFICDSGAPVSYNLVYGKLKYAQPKPQKGNCNYAINPNCEPNSPDDTVMLFETKIDWNQAGGPEILTIENHQGKGC